MKYNCLADLLSSDNVDDFIDNIWGQKVQYYRNSSVNEPFEILNLTMFELTLSNLNRAHEGWLHFAHGSLNQIPPTMVDKDGLLKMGMIRSAFASGETLYLTKANRLFPTLQSICQIIEKDLSLKGIGLREHVNAHVFLTPLNTQGFQPHRDEHASFIMQVEGVKKWTVYEPSIEQQNVKKNLIKGSVNQTILADYKQHQFQLEPGDIMYMPEFWPHEACASDLHSMHITFRVFPLRWVDIMMKICPEHPILSAHVPRYHSTDSSYLLDSFINKLTSSEFLGPLQKLLQNVLKSSIPLEKNPAISSIEQILVADKVKLNTLLIRPEYIPCRLIETEEEVGIEFSDSIIRGPSLMKTLFEYVLSTKRMRPCDLPTIGTNDELLEIVRSMVRFGLLRIEGYQYSDREAKIQKN